MVDGAGWLWVTDFGLRRSPGADDLTTTGDLLGTLRYLSPEQVRGDRTIVDHRADVYSLGATLYEVIAHRPAFEGDDRLDLVRRIAGEEPPPMRRIDPEVPRDLVTIVAKAMAKEPAERYACEDMADDLSRFLEHRPILAQRPAPSTVRPSGRGCTGRRWRRRPCSWSRPLSACGSRSRGGIGTSAGITASCKPRMDLAGEHEQSAQKLLVRLADAGLAQQAWASGQVDLDRGAS